jgi:hypothetical protein
LGDSWLQALRAYDLLKSKTAAAEFWIVSAGLGLISAGTLIPEYSATFSLGDSNSVGTSVADNRRWWSNLAARRNKSGRTGSISKLAAQNPDSVFLVGLSAVYLRALLPDLIGARNALTNPGKLCIVSTGSGEIPELGNSLLPLDARFENKLGGARTTLNNRLLGHIAESFTLRELRADKLACALAKEAAELEPIRTFNREKMSDERVIKLIRTDLVLAPDTSASALLRKYRDCGLACEQKRFGRLFKLTSIAIRK